MGEIISKVVGIVAISIISGLLLSLVMTLPVMWLWNACVPEIFGLHEIGFWAAFQLLLLCSLLFKSTTSSSND